MIPQPLSEFLSEAVERFNQPDFIGVDPISIPHMFSRKEDIEISGFFAATLAWGQRKTIISKSMELMNLMDNAPFEFLVTSNDKEFIRFHNFVHRTFNDTDSLYFLHSLRNIYKNYGGPEGLFETGYQSDEDVKAAILYFRKVFFSLPHLPRTQKHFPDPGKNSACKRFNLFLRWMVRNDNHGVDFGLWKSINPARLFCPLDLHSGRVARKLGLLSRKQDDWRAVEELTSNLRLLDPLDPVKYDFALFGLGAFKKM